MPTVPLTDSFVCSQAAVSGAVNLVEALLQARASPYTQDKRGCTPVDVAAEGVKVVLECAGGGGFGGCSEQLNDEGEELFTGQRKSVGKDPWEARLKAFLKLRLVIWVRQRLHSSVWWADMSAARRKRLILGAAVLVGLVALWIAWCILSWLASVALAPFR